MFSDTELNTFLKKLDDRYEAKVKKQGMLMVRKGRKVGCPSSTPPPPNAAAWTVQKNRENSELIDTLLLFYAWPTGAECETSRHASFSV